uniref:Uncharacterized protein n=1 Tax=Romanomermis culicivorax TaxID=13658 RepID=A0A915HK96_ROMCU
MSAPLAIDFVDLQGDFPMRLAMDSVPNIFRTSKPTYGSPLHFHLTCGTLRSRPLTCRNLRGCGLLSSIIGIIFEAVQELNPDEQFDLYFLEIIKQICVCSARKADIVPYNYEQYAGEHTDS